MKIWLFDSFAVVAESSEKAEEMLGAQGVTGIDWLHRLACLELAGNPEPKVIYFAHTASEE